MAKSEASFPPEDHQDQLKDRPLRALEVDELDHFVTRLFEKEFEGKNSVTLEELRIGGRLARNYPWHERPTRPVSSEDPVRDYTPSLDSESVPALIPEHVWPTIEAQQSKQLWKEPKELLITLLICCIASMTQGWDQVANGNLQWPTDFGLQRNEEHTGSGDWKFGFANAAMWFSAAILGPFLVDPICHSRFFGRRGSVFIAALFSLSAPIACSRTTTWQGYLITRVILGIGIGAKASIVPIWESEILPPAKRGRLLVSWQVFTAVGIFAGSVATYIFRNNWRNQVLSGALPAFTLLVTVLFCCESPRWLIVQEKYIKAFNTLVKLRKERLLAAEEFCYIYFQVQTERAFMLTKKEISRPDFSTYRKRISYWKRLPRLVTIQRNRRAAIATMIVMISQQLSGINILAFLATTFFATAQLNLGSEQATRNQNIGLSIGFGAANAIFSVFGYFLIEPLPIDTSIDKAYASGPNAASDTRLVKTRRLLYGRRRLLLQSLGSGTLMLLALTFLLRLPPTNPHKLGAVTTFVLLFTLCYSPGAGAVPFSYSTEVWPNEGRDIGMSWGVFWNFLGSALLAAFVPRGLAWSNYKLFGIFTGLSLLGTLLVYFFIPSTDYAISLEEMTSRFQDSLLSHAAGKVSRDSTKVTRFLPIKVENDSKKGILKIHYGRNKHEAQSNQDVEPQRSEVLSVTEDVPPATPVRSVQ